MFENVCTLPVTGDIFAQALHPTEPVLTVGLFNGRVQAFRLPQGSNSASSNGDDEDDAESSILSDGKSMINTIWETRRHKQSCRTLAYAPDGDFMFSAGAEGIVKHFSSTTGKVISKTAVPHFTSKPDTPSLLHAIDPNHLLLACDSGALHLFDVRTPGGLASKPARTSFPHTDYISSIVPLPPANPTSNSGTESKRGAATTAFPKQWVSTGGTTLAVTDLRSGTLVRSDDQEDDLLCATYVPGIGPKKSTNRGVVAVGGSTGVLTMWDRGSWDDQQERIIVDTGKGGGESIDALALIPEELGYGKTVVAGMGDGSLRLVDLLKREVTQGPGLRHDEIEGVVAVDFDCYGRMVTGGGRTIKIWEELTELQGGDEDSDSDEEEDSDDDSDSDAEENDGANKKRARESSSEDEDESDSEAERERERKAKQKKRQEAIAQRLGPMGAHGVLKFDGLD